MFFNTSRNLKTRWTRKQESPSKLSAQMKGENTDWGTSSSIANIME